MHLCMDLTFACITGEIKSGIESMSDATSALRALGDGRFLALQGKLNEYYEFYNEGNWSGKRGNAIPPDAPLDKMN